MRGIIGIVSGLGVYLLLSTAIWFSYPDSMTREPAVGASVFLAVVVVAFVAMLVAGKLGRAYALGLGGTLVIVGLLATLVPTPVMYGEPGFDWSFVLLLGGRTFVAGAVGAAVVALALAQRPRSGEPSAKAQQLSASPEEMRR